MRNRTHCPTIQVVWRRKLPPELAKRGPAVAGQRGAIGIMLAVLLPAILGVLGLSLELAQLYNRKVEMQAIADAIALSAARQLNGTPGGIDNALAAARDVVENGYDWTRLKYGYRQSLTFSDAAIRFAAFPDGGAGWVNQTEAKAAPERIAYVQVDTNGLDPSYGQVNLVFMRFVSTLASVQVGHSAVAGKQRLKVTPLAICAMSTDSANPIQERTNPNASELTEYGFRRGVSYNLLKLNPKGSAPMHYLVDPISPPPKSKASNFDIATAGQYVCTGTVESPVMPGRPISVQKDFPIAQLVNHLNSRFDASKGACSPISAPPDSNIRSFAFGGNSWMNSPAEQVSSKVETPSRLHTFADQAPMPTDDTPTKYGPLWVYARAVPWSSYTPGQREPAQGYETFSATSIIWKNLYGANPVLKTYPSGSNGKLSPYFTQVIGPTANPPGIQFRRVLNIPLLDCPVTGSQGSVVAIGKFFMTVPADANGVYAEFAGIASSPEIAGPVGLYQ